MENVNRWYFTKEQLANTPSRKFDIDPTRELSYRQQAANFIQDMGQRLQLSQLCINTAIVYMHRFYVFHSFTEVHRNKLSISALFLAAKVEEQPRKLEHVIKVGHACLHKDAPQLDVRSEAYAEKMTEVAAHENVLLQTLGFVLAIEHPHTYVVKVCQLVKASKDLAQTSYIMATTSLHMTTMCLQYKPTVVACVCIHLACKWSSYMIEPCSEGRDWFYYVDRSVTWELLESLTQEFIAILETSPHRFKRKFGKDAGGYPGPKNLLPLENAEIADSPDKPSTSSHPTAVPQPCASSQAQASSQPVFQPPTSTLPTTQPSLTTQPSAPPQVPAPVVSSSSAPQPSQPLVNSHSSGELPQENAHKPSPVTKDVKTNGSKETELLEKKPPTSNEHVSSKKSSEQSSSKHERREKRKHSSHSSKDKVSSSNHSEQTTGIKVKIRKDIINLSGVESSSQKYVPPVKLETQSPKTSIKIKIPKPPPMVETPKVEKEKPVTPASLKIVLTKDKSGSGSYSTSHKNERESRKRSHNSGTPQGIYKNSHESSMKYVKVEHQFQKNHSGDMRHNKVSRHSSHRSGMDSTPNNVSSARLPHPVGSENSTFQNYQPVPNYQNYPFQLTPPPPPPKLRGHGMLVGKTNSGLPAQPPLPPPQPPPPPPPPE